MFSKTENGSNEKLEQLLLLVKMINILSRLIFRILSLMSEHFCVGLPANQYIIIIPNTLIGQNYRLLDDNKNNIFFHFICNLLENWYNVYEQSQI